MDKDPAVQESNENVAIFVWSVVCVFLTPIFVSFLLKKITRTSNTSNTPSSSTGYSSYEKTKSLFSYLNLISAGIFVGVVFFHILPETQEDPKLVSVGILLGFFCMLWIDRVLVGHHGIDHHLDGDLFSLRPDHQGVNGALKMMTTDKAVMLSVFVALSLHSFLAGLAVGQQQFDSTIIPFVFFFCIHKGLDSVAVTSRIIQSGVNDRNFWFLVFLFSLITPFGIILSYFLSKSSELEWVGGHLETFSGGVLMYVGLMDILIDELESTTSKLVKYKIFIFFVSTFLIFVVEND